MNGMILEGDLHQVESNRAGVVLALVTGTQVNNHLIQEALKAHLLGKRVRVVITLEDQ